MIRNIRHMWLGVWGCIALLLAFPGLSLAQVWSTGTNGQVGYYGTPTPVSPNCAPGMYWAITNGHAQCQMPAPPTCPGGYTQTSAPWWNGSSWVGLACSPPAPFDASTACAGATPGGYTAGTAYSYNSGYSDPSWAAQSGYPGDTAYLASGWGPGYPNACGNTHYEYALVCYVWSNSIAGYYLTPSNSTSCGGTH
jgi:hypothetical protein